MKQKNQSKLMWILGVVIIAFVILAFGTAAIVQPYRVDRYFKPTVFIHILLSMSWLFLFVYQSRLIIKGKIEKHRKNALLGMLLVPLILIEAIYITYEWGDPRRLIGESRDVLVFAILFFISIWAAKKGKLQTHKRLLLIAALNLIAPAITRVSFVFDWSRPTGILISILIWIFVPIFYDLLSIRKIHKATIFGIIFTILSFVLMIAFILSPLMKTIESIMPK